MRIEINEFCLLILIKHPGEAKRLSLLFQPAQIRQLEERGKKSVIKFIVSLAPLLMPMPIHLKRSLKVFFDEIWAGAYCTFARDKAKGDIYICGLNNYNQLGYPETSPIFHPVPAPTFNGKHWIQISGGQHHTLALDESVSGFFHTHQFLQVVLKIRNRGDLVPGDVFSMGTGDVGQLGLGPDVIEKGRPAIIQSLSTVVEICAGGMHTVCLTKDGKLVVIDFYGIAHSLGRKEYGRLGLGPDSDDAERPTSIPTLLSKKTIWVACGSSVSYAVTEDGSAFSWGMGTNYQLGFGDDDSDVHEPKIIKSKQLEGRKTICISGGGQHAVILAAKVDAVPKAEAKDAERNSKE
ncbi:hypothetical protein J437_LFUL007615 [Ladona fulva]|uniref:Uncharacterized protein n=1 Tax=Ladona fulva TaxID=123851 RepID=A0A8K0K6N2_LADFU|nr:hypothetical protein J437_LFUL007615 [Ladona fulva]